MRYSLRSLISIVTCVVIILAVGMTLTLTLRRQLAIREGLKSRGASWIGFASAEDKLLPNALYQSSVVDDFQHHERIGTVELKCFDVTPQCIERLCNLEHIDSLNIISCNLCDEDLLHLPEMNVSNLLLWNANITDSVVDILSQAKGLKKITLVSTKLTPQGIDKLQSALPDVTIVSRP